MFLGIDWFHNFSWDFVLLKSVHIHTISHLFKLSRCSSYTRRKYLFYFASFPVQFVHLSATQRCVPCRYSSVRFYLTEHAPPKTAPLNVDFVAANAPSLPLNSIYLARGQQTKLRGKGRLRPDVRAEGLPAATFERTHAAILPLSSYTHAYVSVYYTRVCVDHLGRPLNGRCDEGNANGGRKRRALHCY